MPATLDTTAGQAVYSPWVLHLYDAYVLGFSCSLAWRCPSRRMLAQYDRLVGRRHLDVGVGSGYYLDRCRFPGDAPEITLLDLNPSSLAHAARRIGRYGPRTIRHDVFEPILLGGAETPAPPGPPFAPGQAATPAPSLTKAVPVSERFESIGISFLLHCLPGTMAEKAAAIANLAPALADGGVLFGSTILGTSAAHNLLGRVLLRAYNRRGIFSNLDDTEAGLTDALGASFATVQAERVGSVVLFEARRPRRTAA